MPNFWGYISNTNYAIGCTGQTVYVYDNGGKELARFKDVAYGYTPKFCPEKNMFIVKSTTGMIAVYSLDKLELIKKYRFSKVNAAQDDGFCFSNDGKLLYNIERHIDSLHTRISIYDTENFNLSYQLFVEKDSQVLSYIEYDKNKHTYFLIGFMRGGNSVYDCGFIAELNEHKLCNIRKLSENEYEFITGYKHLELLGFTAKAKEWSGLKYRGYDLTDIEATKVQLSDYIN